MVLFQKSSLVVVKIGFGSSRQLWYKNAQCQFQSTQSAQNSNEMHKKGLIHNATLQAKKWALLMYLEINLLCTVCAHSNAL